MSELLARLRLVLEGRYRVKGYHSQLILPEYNWDKQNLRDNNQRLNWLTSLAQSNRIPWRMVYEEANLNPGEVERELEEQAQREAERRAAQPPPPGSLGGMLGAEPLGLEGGGGEMLLPVEGPPEFAPPESYEALGEEASPLERQMTEAEAPVLEA